MSAPTFAKLRVSSRREETPELTLLRVEGEGGCYEEHRRPGQYVAVRLPEAERPVYLALASAPGERHFELLVRGGGRFAEALRHLGLGDTVEVSEPLGLGYPLELAREHDLWLVGVGSGLAALRPVLQLVARPGNGFRPVHLLFGAREWLHVPFRQEMEDWRCAGIEVMLATSRDEAGAYQGYVQDALATQHPDLSRSVLFVCGMKPMIEAVRGVATRLGLPPDRLYTNS